jgi:hypothetical protein
MVFIQAIEKSDVWKTCYGKYRFMDLMRRANNESVINSYLINCIKEHFSAEDAADEYIADLEMRIEKQIKEDQNLAKAQSFTKAQINYAKKGK